MFYPVEDDSTMMRNWHTRAGNYWNGYCSTSSKTCSKLEIKNDNNISLRVLDGDDTNDEKVNDAKIEETEKENRDE